MEIEARNLRKVYPDGKEALGGLSLRIPEGMFGLLGPNGSGKSTLMNIAAMLLEPTSGEILYDGRVIATRKDRLRVRSLLGYLPQDFEPVPHLTGREYLRFSLGFFERRRGRESRRIVHEMLDLVGLLKAADRKAGGYSSGMKRRLGIAQAMIHKPKVLIVDEPTSGLDPEERVKFRNIIAGFGEGITAVLSTHIVGDIERTCGRLAIVRKGKLLYNGYATELMERVAGKCWEIGITEEELAVYKEKYPITSILSDNGRVTVRVISEHPIEGGREVEPSLEDAYIHRIREDDGGTGEEEEETP